MSINSFAQRIARSFERSWRAWLLVGITAAMVGDVAYHVLSGRGQNIETASITARAPAKTTGVTLTPAQIAAGGIAIEVVATKPLAEVFRAPGEVRVNDYSTSNVSSRLRATVISRQAKLGDRVRKGQTLLTLYSADMAEAESAFVLASKNYVRMNNLKDYISGQQFDEADVKRQEARGRLETYGLAPAEIADLTSNGLGNRPSGQFDVLAPQDGIITTDAFRAGEVVEPGKTLFEVADLSSVWVEAQLSPALAPRVAGGRGHIHAGNRTFEARIVQTHQELSEVTRTVGIRLQLENTSGALKPGEFVDVELFGPARPLIALPTAAVLRDGEGNSVVYIETVQGKFEPTKVQALFTADDQVAITGLSPGMRVVTAGAFFVKSEADKSSFADED